MAVAVKNLNQVSPKAFSTLMSEENLAWKSRLRWDYSSTQDFLRNYIAMGMVPGVAVVDGEEAVGYIYVVIDGSRAIIGNYYVLSDYRDQGIEEKMISTLVQWLQSLPEVSRIEGQLIPFDCKPPEEILEKYGFDVFRRSYMSLDLAQWPEGETNPNEDGLRVYSEVILPKMADVVYDSYIGGIDAHFSSSFADRDRCRDFVTNLVRRNGCGTFLPGMTTIMTEGKGNVIGTAIATRLDADSGHLPQISVRRDHHGNGVGKLMVHTSLNRFKDRNYEVVSLTVSRQNRSAYEWYQRLGFMQVLSFNAYLWQK